MAYVRVVLRLLLLCGVCYAWVVAPTVTMSSLNQTIFFLICGLGGWGLLGYHVVSKTIAYALGDWGKGK